MIEVETKVKIENIAIIRKKVRKIAKFNVKQKKIDDYYTLESLSTYPKKSLRVRKKNNIYEVNFKQPLSFLKGIHAKNEHEFYINDIKNFLILIKEFGFKRWVRKIKVSEIYEINSRFHIELNNVKNLGWFMEIEYLAMPGEEKKARESVYKILEKLDIPKKMIIKEGYTKQLWNKGLHFN